MAKTAEERQLETKLKGVMEFYVTTYFEYYSTKVKEEVRKHNAWIESDMVDRQIEDWLKEIGVEAAQKFHDIALLILDSFVSGREHKVRQFELLFIDLLKRTLIADMKEEKNTPAQIIIIADPNVNAEEN